MKLKNVFHISLIILLTFYGCGRNDKEKEPETGMQIRLSDDSTRVELYAVPDEVISELKLDSLEASEWMNFFAVYKDTTDTELRDLQPALYGSYDVYDNKIRFKPADNFKKRVSYFARCY